GQGRRPKELTDLPAELLITSDDERKKLCHEPRLLLNEFDRHREPPSASGRRSARTTSLDADNRDDVAGDVAVGGLGVDEEPDEIDDVQLRVLAALLTVGINHRVVDRDDDD